MYLGGIRNAKVEKIVRRLLGILLRLFETVIFGKMPGRPADLRFELLNEVNSPISSDIMGYHLREGKHNIVLYDWQQYVVFVDRFLK